MDGKDGRKLIPITKTKSLLPEDESSLSEQNTPRSIHKLKLSSQSVVEVESKSLI